MELLIFAFSGANRSFQMKTSQLPSFFFGQVCRLFLGNFIFRVASSGVMVSALGANLIPPEVRVNAVHEALFCIYMYHMWNDINRP